KEPRRDRGLTRRELDVARKVAVSVRQVELCKRSWHNAGVREHLVIVWDDRRRMEHGTRLTGQRLSPLTDPRRDGHREEPVVIETPIAGTRRLLTVGRRHAAGQRTHDGCRRTETKT